MTNMKKRHYWLYVLKLEQDKKYIGVTSKTPEYRMHQHQNEFLGAAWTKQYKPVEIFDKKDLGFMTYKEAQKYENKVVRIYINKYGHDNVRGGDISTTNKLVKRFGYYWDKEGWDAIMMIILLMSVVVLQAVIYYLK